MTEERTDKIRQPKFCKYRTYVLEITNIDYPFSSPSHQRAINQFVCELVGQRDTLYRLCVIDDRFPPWCPLERTPPREEASER
jgi:hypothetical protein